MVAVISKQFGLQHIEIAEDVVSETFLTAAETWETNGIPLNPAAWLYAVAKQKTLYYFRRNKIFEEKVIPAISIERSDEMEEMKLDFSNENIRDSQLQMMFAICNPAIASEAQIGLALRILCGFGIDEIAEAFLSNKETVNKRLFRAREKLRTEKIKMQLPPAGEISKRLDNVLHIIYLLFNEGYYSKTKNQILQKDFCIEAMRLCMMLTDFERTDLPKTNALMALMCFHASRFNARQTPEESLILYDRQDETLWDQELIRRGMHYLNLSMQGNEITSYHIEAQIAFRHSIKKDTRQKWISILDLYDQLLKINYSPAVALNRIYALYKVHGPQLALLEAELLKLENNHFYFLILGELYSNIDKELAKSHFQHACSLAKTQTEKSEIQKKIGELDLPHK
ncbi:MAG: RNA polymerase subunit sigma [Chitinophagaceae bacterium]|nr:MAG: RNA polymerase subunit sigma [Chitinophagaceae bacterium]